MSFISLRVRTAIVVHGYDAANKEIIEKYVQVTSSHGRVMYWEYEGGMTALKQRRR